MNDEILLFGRLPPDGAACQMLTEPPALRLQGTEHGWIDLIVDAPGHRFDTITLSDVYPPLADLWCWSLAVAWGVLPVAVHLDEEAPSVWLWVDPLSDGQLQLGLMRTPWRMPIDKAPALECLCWQEARTDFLLRWGKLWGDFLSSNTFDERQWEGDPEPMRDMPWAKLADVPELEPPPWPLSARVAWFYLTLAHHLRRHGPDCTYTENPARWTLHEMQMAALCLRAAQMAWRTLRQDEPPGDEPWRLIQAGREVAWTGADASSQKHERALHSAWMTAWETVFDAIARVADTLLPLLPIAPGSHFADEAGRRAVLIQSQGRQWLLYWEDGRITCEDAFHAGRFPSWRWPVARGPRFDRAALDPIDQRRLRFLELKASPVGIVCPVCGYPCMDDDVDDVSTCDICGYPTLWEQTHGKVPALDATVDEEGEPISPTLRERRAYFLDHGDAWPADHAFGPDDDAWGPSLRDPVQQRLARACMAEWDAWLEHPDPQNTPEEVWRRWIRLEEQNRRPEDET